MEAGEDYFSSLKTLRISNPYLFQVIPPFLVGTENVNKNLASLGIKGILFCHFSQTG